LILFRNKYIHGAKMKVMVFLILSTAFVGCSNMSDKSASPKTSPCNTARFIDTMPYLEPPASGIKCGAGFMWLERTNSGVPSSIHKPIILEQPQGTYSDKLIVGVSTGTTLRLFKYTLDGDTMHIAGQLGVGDLSDHPFGDPRFKDPFHVLPDQTIVETLDNSIAGFCARIHCKSP
jgi:hypothetical protein